MKLMLEVCHQGGPIAALIDPHAIVAVVERWTDGETDIHLASGLVIPVKGNAYDELHRLLQEDLKAYEREFGHEPIEIYARPFEESAT